MTHFRIDCKVIQGNGGKVAHSMVAIGYRLGIVQCRQYHGRLIRQFFADFNREEFPKAFKSSTNPRGKLFLQDGDPKLRTFTCGNVPNWGKKIQYTSPQSRLEPYYREPYSPCEAIAG